MMGVQSKQAELWAQPVDVFRRIPEKHILRRLQAVLDLNFVREEVAALYGKRGNISVDPAVIMKMMLLLFLDDVASERELMRVIPLRIDYLWFLGYGFEDEIPDHSVLSKARARWGKEVFERLFSRTVEQCLRAGLVGGSKVHVDASLVRADASLNSVVEATVAKLEQKEEPGQEEGGGGKGGPGRGAINRKYRVESDPEATVARHRGGGSLPSYKNHRVLDDTAGVITAVRTTTGAKDEGEELVALVEEHRERVERKPRAVVADSKYGTNANFAEMAAQGIRSHMGDLRARQNNVKLQGIYPSGRFAYDKATDTYRCPAGRTLRWHHYVAGRGYSEYRAGEGVCGRCRLAHLCTRAKAGRTLKRYPEQELIERARRQSHGPGARADRKRRQWLQERNFGEAAVHHGFKRARWRGIVKQSIQDLLIAAVQNLKILLRKGDWDLASRWRRLMGGLVRLIDSIRRTMSFPATLSAPSPRVFV